MNFGFCHFYEVCGTTVCVGNANPLGKAPQDKALSSCIFIPEAALGAAWENVSLDVSQHDRGGYSGMLRFLSWL